MYKRKELIIIGVFIVISLLFMYFSREEEIVEPNYQSNPIEVTIEGEILRETTLYYYRATTYGGVLRKI